MSNAATVAVTNITGLRARSRGLSFFTASRIAGTRSAALNIEVGAVMIVIRQKSWPPVTAR